VLSVLILFLLFFYKRHYKDNGWQSVIGDPIIP